MQDRKRLEEALESDRQVGGAVSDLDTLFELAREGEDVSIGIRAGDPSFLANAREAGDGDAALRRERSPQRDHHDPSRARAAPRARTGPRCCCACTCAGRSATASSAVVTDRLEGEGAGIKSVTFEVNGENAYGLLQSEIGVHRLVRISPFDSAARRHTSFASVFVYPQIDDEIKIDIKPEDLRVDVFRASGAGGQHVNRTESAVRMTHLPTGIVVQCQNERSQHKNRASAMKQLRARLYEFELEKKREEERKLEDSKLDINFGSQIRSYVLAPYRLIKDHRTKFSVGDVDRVLDGDLEGFIHAYLVWKRTGRTAADGADEIPD